MIHWVWLLAAFVLGEAVGLVIAAILSSNEPRKPEHKYIK